MTFDYAMSLKKQAHIPALHLSIFECVPEEGIRKQFAFTLIVFGAIYAFFALVQELSSNGNIFWIYAPRFNGSIYGSYVNHNHHAGLMEMLVPVVRNALLRQSGSSHGR